MIRIYKIEKGRDKREFADTIATELWNTTITREPNGKPQLTNNSHHISISHTASYWAIMDSDHQCGVDIELTSRKAEHVARKFTNDKEIELCKKVFEHNPTLLIWCAKEALYKYFSREGVDFRTDLKITKAEKNRIQAQAFNCTVTLEWYTTDQLLIVHTI